MTRIPRPLVFLFAVCLLAFACGDDDDATSSPTVDDSTSTVDDDNTPGAVGTNEPTDEPTEVPGGDEPTEPESSLDPSEKEPSVEDIGIHVDMLAETIGERPAGGDAEQEAADYIQSELESWGYSVEQQAFPISSAVNDLSSVEAEGQRYVAYAAQGSGSGDAEAPLVYVGLGKEEEFPREAAGAIALVMRGEIPFSEKASNAQAAGARALIIFNNEPGYFGATLGGRAEIPVVLISGLDGGALKDAAAAGETASVSVKTSEASESQNVIGQRGDGLCRVVIGGHYDSVTAAPGGVDNASGTAAFLEVAETLAARGLTDGVCFVGFGAEEIGLVGSRYFVDQLSQDEGEALLAAINLDTLGFGDDLRLVGTRSLEDLMLRLAQDEGLELERFNIPVGASSDHASFLEAELPAVFFFTANLGPIHTPADTADQVNRETVRHGVVLTVAAVESLLDE